MRISDWSSDVCSSDLIRPVGAEQGWQRPGNPHRFAASLYRPLRQLTRQRGQGLAFCGETRFANMKRHHGIAVAGDHVGAAGNVGRMHGRSEEHTSELQSLMRISYAVFCLKKKKKHNTIISQVRSKLDTTISNKA